MANKYTKLPCPKREELVDLYESKNMSQLELCQHYGKSLKVIQRWFKELKIKPRRQIKRNQTRERNSHWKGDNVGYKTYHQRVQAQRGKPSRCEMCETTTAKKFEWASMTRDFKNIYDYIRLCVSCHKKFDKIHLNLGSYATKKN